MADHYTKQLTPTLSYRHTDYIMGHVPPLYSPVFKSSFYGIRPSKKEELTYPAPPFNLPKKYDSIPAAAAAAKLFACWSTIIQGRVF